MNKPTNENISDMAEFFKVFGDPTRMKILLSLLGKEMCVNCITDTTEVSQSAISHQLRILRTSGLVKSRRVGKQIYYSLDDDHIKSILEIAHEHVNHKRQV
ncbi:ArsR/SmtB family transcription factor [Alkalibacter mobilis]|uniref:ArsR/SmtB family transcription factor n=1 Tax=Alkalibacter mobilis TaxID=2787712 RepID=UPI00189E4320|nr:metalloregulator ArsR/SmtB family transcription factor [Alkalibacter mobilis]MBF7096033.1 winged helix-turn-helix transcriptional regulator [Alkalibacter mobilis]